MNNDILSVFSLLFFCGFLFALITFYVIAVIMILMIYYCKYCKQGVLYIDCHCSVCNCVPLRSPFSSPLGATTFFSGSGPLVNRAMLVGAVQVGTYDQFREMFRGMGITNQFSNVFSASMVSGLIMAVVTMPLETAKNRMAFQKPDAVTGNTLSLLGLYSFFDPFIIVYSHNGTYVICLTVMIAFRCCAHSSLLMFCYSPIPFLFFSLRCEALYRPRADDDIYSGQGGSEGSVPRVLPLLSSLRRTDIVDVYVC